MTTNNRHQEATAAGEVDPAALTEAEREDFLRNLRQNLGYRAFLIGRTTLNHVDRILAARHAAATPAPVPQREADDHEFRPVAGHPDDDECAHRIDGTDATYCGHTRSWHEHDPRCYQRVGTPNDLPTDLCDCETWRLIDAAKREADAPTRRRPYCLRCEVPIFQDKDGVWRREATGSSVCPRCAGRTRPHEPMPECPSEAGAPTQDSLHDKFRVERVAPSSRGIDHTDCRYFVLDPQHDPIAASALGHYAALARAEGRVALADDLADWLTEAGAPTQDDAVAALERLADQAWHTAGNTKGRERVHEDRAAVLALLAAGVTLTPTDADLRERVEDARARMKSLAKTYWADGRHPEVAGAFSGCAELLDAALGGPS